NPPWNARSATRGRSRNAAAVGRRPTCWADGAGRCIAYRRQRGCRVRLGIAKEDDMKRSSSRLLGAVLAAGLGAAAWCATAGEAHWSYTGATGPAKWGTLDKNFALCKSGTVQSPINIPDADVRKGDLPSLLFNYKPSPLRMIDNDHTIQVNYAPGSFVTVSGKQYELVRLEFHKPSEIKVSGKDHEMAVHLVHQDKQGKLAVVAGVFHPGQGKPSDQDAVEQPAAGEGQGECRRRGEDQRDRAAPVGKGLLLLPRIPDDASLHGERRLVRAQNTRPDFRRADRAIREALPDE